MQKPQKLKLNVDLNNNSKSRSGNDHLIVINIIHTSDGDDFDHFAKPNITGER